LRVMCAARDSDVRHTAIEQVFRAEFGIDVNQHAVGGLSLAGMTGYGIAVIEMRMQTRIELQLAASVHLQTQPPVLADTLHRSQLTVRHLQLARGRGELHPVSGGERPLLVTISNNLNRYRNTGPMEAGLTDHVWCLEELCALMPKPTVKASTIEEGAGLVLLNLAVGQSLRQITQ